VLDNEEKYQIVLDLDRDRIRAIVRESYTAVRDMLSTDPRVTEEAFVASIDPYLNSNRVTNAVTLYLPSKQYPEMRIEVNLRRKSVIARMANRKKQAYVNHFLTNL